MKSLAPSLRLQGWGIHSCLPAIFTEGGNSLEILIRLKSAADSFPFILGFSSAAA